MAKRIFEIDTERLFSSEAFLGATANELRVLVAVMADRAATDEAIAEAANVSAARCRSALALFETEGILTAKDTVSHEFEAPITDVEEDSAKQVAQSIRDHGLSSFLNEFAKLLKKPSLSTCQVKKLIDLHENFALSEEYLLSLSAYLADKKTLTVPKLVREAVKLCERDIDTPEALYAYIDQKKKTNDAQIRIRKLFELNDRALSDEERTYFSIWIYDYGYSEQIISKAYSINIANIGTYKAKYIHEILTRWHSAGCKTLAECLSQSERDRAVIKAETKKNNASQKTDKNDAPQSPKYGAFSAEDALMRALERSYGAEEN